MDMKNKLHFPFFRPPSNFR